MNSFQNLLSGYTHRKCFFYSCIIWFDSCVDDSGNWGRGGLFNALAKLSDSVPKAYERASEFDDLHLGDLHLLEITGEHI